MNHKSKLAKVIDNVSIFLLSFLAIYIFLYSTIKINTVALIISAFLSITISTSIIMLSKKVEHKKILSQKDAANLQNVLTALKFGNPQKLSQFWEKLLSKFYTPEILPPFFFIIKDNQKIAITFQFNLDTLNLNEVKNLVSATNGLADKIYIYAPNFDSDAKTFQSQSKNLFLFDAADTYNLLKKAKLTPILSSPTKSTTKTKEKLSKIISKKFVYKYLKFGLLLICFGLITPFKTLYFTLGAILIALGIISLLKPEKQSITPIIDPI